MIDLIGMGLNLGERDGKQWVEIPSILFVKKCEEWIAANPGKSHSPL